MEFYQVLFEGGRIIISEDSTFLSCAFDGCDVSTREGARITHAQCTFQHGKMDANTALAFGFNPKDVVLEI